MNNEIVFNVIFFLASGAIIFGSVIAIAWLYSLYVGRQP